MHAFIQETLDSKQGKTQRPCNGIGPRASLDGHTEMEHGLLVVGMEGYSNDPGFDYIKPLFSVGGLQ